MLSVVLLAGLAQEAPAGRAVFRESWIEGRVLGSSGETARGFTVHVHEPGKAGFSGSWPSRWHVPTDEGGSFRLGPLPAGRWSLVAKKDGVDRPWRLVEAEVPERGTLQDVVLPVPTGSVQLKILRPDGTRAAGVVVHAFLSGQDPPCTLSRALGLRADEEGSCEIPYLWAEPFEFFVSSPEDGWTHAPRFPVDGAEHEVRLRSGGAIRLRAVSYPGGPSVGAVSATLVSEAPEEGDRAPACRGPVHSSSKDGEVLFRGLPPGTYSLTVEPVASATSWIGPRRRTGVRVPDGKAVDVGEVSFDLGAVKGRVVRPDGSPVSGAKVWSAGRFRSMFSGEVPSPESRAESGADGTFTLDRLTAGPVSVFASTDSFPPSSSEVFDLSVGGLVEGVRVRLSPGASVEGIVRDRYGSPVAGAQVLGGPPPYGLPFPLPRTNADSDGTFHLDGLAPGWNRIAAYPVGRGGASFSGGCFYVEPYGLADVHLAPGEKRRVDLVPPGPRPLPERRPFRLVQRNGGTYFVSSAEDSGVPSSFPTGSGRIRGSSDPSCNGPMGFLLLRRHGTVRLVHWKRPDGTIDVSCPPGTWRLFPAEDPLPVTLRVGSAPRRVLAPVTVEV